MIPAILSCLAVLLLLFQYVTLAKLSALPASVSFLGLGRFVEALAERVDFDGTDALLAALILSCALALVTLELRGARLTGFLRTVFASERRTLLLLLATSLVLVRFYLAPGSFNWAADSAQHIVYTDLTARSLAALESPWWTYYLGTGSPHLQFYGFLFFLVSGPLAMVLPTYSALKVALALCHALSALSLYCLARRTGCGRAAAFVAGLAYALCFWHTQQVLIMGRLQLSLLYALLPWCLYGFEAVCRRVGSPLSAALLGGSALGLVILTHPGYGYWSCAFAALYMLLRLWGDVGLARRVAPFALLLLLTGLVVGAALVVPMWVDRHSTGLSAGFDLYGVPDPRWWWLFVWSNFRFWLIPPDPAGFNWYGGYLGLSLLLLAMAGVGLLRWRRYRSAALPAILCLVATLCMVLAYRTWPIHMLPGSGLLASGRYLLFTTLFLALAAGHGVRALQIATRSRSHRTATFALLVVLLDLGPTTFQHPYAREGQLDPAGFPVDTYQYIRATAAPFEARGELPDYRAFFALGGVHHYTAVGLLYWLGRSPNPDGPHPGELVAAADFTRPLERYLSWRFRRDGIPASGQMVLDPTGEAGLCLLNTRFLLVREEDHVLSAAELPHRTPILVSDTAAPFQEMLDASPEIASFTDSSRSGEVAQIARVMALIQGMEVDPQARTCRVIYLRGLPARQQLGTRPQVEVLRHKVRNSRVELQVQVTAPCFARLAYAYYPHTQVLVDGRTVEALETQERFTALRLDAGGHMIVLQPRLSALRRGLGALSLLTVLAAVVLCWRTRRRTSRMGEG